VPDELLRGLPPHPCLERAPRWRRGLAQLGREGERVVADGGARGRGWPEGGRKPPAIGQSRSRIGLEVSAHVVSLGDETVMAEKTEGLD
jgi:hypothetical protein